MDLFFRIRSQRILRGRCFARGITVPAESGKALKNAICGLNFPGGWPMKGWGSVPAPTSHYTMAGIQLSGLASGLDWKSLVDQLMNVEHVPVDRLQTEKDTNSSQSSALKGLGTELAALQTAVTNIKDQTLFAGRTTSSDLTGSQWNMTAAAGTAPGSHVFNVTQLAAVASRQGVIDITGGLSATDSVAGVTLATMRTAGVVTAGKFTVNGHQITVATTDSLEDVFNAIHTATGDDVTATYSAADDKITLHSASNATISLGAANDTSNFLQVLKLTNNGTDTIASYGKLGTARNNLPFASAGLKTAITAVDGTGAGTFSINGVAISYNVNTDSMSTVLNRINSSDAGVNASYDPVNDRVTLANKKTGDLSMTLSESGGGLLGALGLTAGYTSVGGKNAIYTVDGGPPLISASNTLDGAAHGITGLTVTVNSETTQTVKVAADTGKMRTQISAFISAYNAVQNYIDDTTEITSTNGKVTTSVLSSNRDIQDWARQLRKLAFNSISGVSDTVKQIGDLGLDLDKDGKMSITDSTKLDSALANHATDIEKFFNTTGTGFSARFDTLLTKLTAADTASQDNLTKSNARLDAQMADMERRLTTQRELLTNSFIAMESAQSTIKQQSQTIASAFGTNSSSSSSSSSG